MNINDKIHGFVVTREIYVPDVSGKLYELTHEGSGAYLAYLDRKDENKTFAIGFKTLPVDDTGVFHIIEHSVLCGSDKYPVKEPFVELLKGSQNTFLNALTYEDRTVYPVSSRNPKDFLNLVSVYMDAVLHPTALTDPKIFRQEGWHYELDDEGNLIYNGVVFNEMKGAYSSADEISMATAKATLFPDTPYRYESGGAPGAIPNLTFEQFCASHKKFYHPTNAMMFLDGEIDVDSTFSLLNDFLKEYTPIEKTEKIAPQSPVDGGTTTVYYEISENEDPDGKARLSLNFVFGTPDDGKLMVATNIIIDALLGSNDAPLKKAILDSGLAEDIDMFSNRTVQQSLQLEARGVKEENIPALESLIIDTIKDIAAKGIDKEALSSVLNAIEFKLREKDYGSFPKGVAFALSVFGATNYGRPAESALTYEEEIKALREALETDYYEKTLLAMTVENPHKSKVIMLPDKDFGKKVSAEEKERLEKIQASMSETELDAVRSETEVLKAWQASVDTPEALATLPSLGIEDIYVSENAIPTSVTTEPYTLINHDIDTSGIGYYKLFFKASDLSEEEIFALNVLTMLLGNVKTDKHSPIEVQNLIKANLGGLSFAVATSGKSDDVAPYLIVTSSALDSKKESMSNLITEVLLTSDLTDKNALKNLLTQSKFMAEDMFSQSGHSVAIGRVMASLYSDGVMKEYISGYEGYSLLKGLIDNFDSQIDEFIQKIIEIRNRVVTRERLTTSVTGKLDRDFIDALAQAIPSDGIIPAKSTIKPLGFKSEAIIVPSRVSYAVLGGDGGKSVSEMLGSLMVSRSILSYEYLWNQIRVLGGAYGAGFMGRRSGFIGCYSYRDPSPMASVEKYKECGSFLGALADAPDADLTKFIIGAIGEYDTLMTPRLAGAKATADYMVGFTAEDDAKVLSDMKNTNSEALKKIASLISKVLLDAVVCVVGSREHIEADKDKFDNIIEI